MKLLVCGGRDYRDWATIKRVLDAVHAKRPVSLVITGAADGADIRAMVWAALRGVKSTDFQYEVPPEEWRRVGKAAGPLRNQRMLDEQRPDGVVAFPGNDGTADMVRRARKAGVKVYEPLRARPAP